MLAGLTVNAQSDSIVIGGGGFCYTNINPNYVIGLEEQGLRSCRFVLDTLSGTVYKYRGDVALGSRWSELELDGGGGVDTILTSVDTDSTLTGDGTSASPLSVVPSGPSIERITLSPTEEIINYGDFALHIENGVSTIVEFDNDFLMFPSSGTVFYIGTTVGATGILEGVTYTSVDNTTLSAMDPATDDYTTVVTSLVTDMDGMFYYAESFNQDISSWDVSNVTDMRFMFYYAESFNQDISSWDVSNVTDMGFMFRYAGAFNGNINNWDVSNVTDMGSMFRNAVAFNGNINNWDVSNVTNMSYMFFYAQSFNKDLSGWCVTNIATEPTSFDTGATSWTLPKPIWGTCP